MYTIVFRFFIIYKFYFKGDHISIFESSARVFNHIDLLTRELFMPIMCIENTYNDQSDKLMDVMHRIMAQVTVTQSQIEVINLKFNYFHNIKLFEGFSFITVTSI